MDNKFKKDVHEMKLIVLSTFFYIGVIFVIWVLEQIAAFSTPWYLDIFIAFTAALFFHRSLSRKLSA